ncbi:MAG: hypothetical protein LH473_09645 [Chitinophagales bacterium]|nr:hypothetical protein [Chitinophagales bacterium]
MNSKQKARWLSEPAEHNYPAAQSYLSLIYEYKAVDELVVKLHEAPLVTFKSKDIFRASGLSLLGISHSQIAKNLQKIENGIELSPILIVRDSANGKVVIADGYHRLCAIYSLDEEALIPCKIV